MWIFLREKSFEFVGRLTCVLVFPFCNFLNALQECFYFLMGHCQLRIDEKIPEGKFQSWALEWSLIIFRVVLMVFLDSYFKSEK